MKTIDLLINARGTLTRLTKVRGSTGASRFPVIKSLDLYGWPLPFAEKELLKHLQEMGINTAKNIYAPAFEISYATYKELESVNRIDITALHYLRNIIEIYTLTNPPIGDIKIRLAHRQSSRPLINFPSNTSDAGRIQEVCNFDDVQYTFNHTKIDWRVKVPSYLGPVIFNHLSMFPNHEINLVDRTTVTGGNVDKNTRANRFVFNDSNRSAMSAIINSTKSNIAKIVPSNAWDNFVKNATFEHYDSSG